MRAAQINSYGEKDVLEYVDSANIPTFKDNQVLVNVKAAGVNPFDITVRSGNARQMAELKLPATLGGDFAGIISETGSEVTGFKIGDEVFGQASPLSGNGSFAEYTPVNDNALSIKPSSIDFVQAAALPLAAVSAFQALVDSAKLQSSQKVLIHGGSGGIGSYAIQIAKHFGAYVSTTVSQNSFDFVKNLGADEVMDYRSQDFTNIIKDYDVILDTVGGDTNEKSYQVLKEGGMLISLAAPINEKLEADYKIKYVYQFTKVDSEKLKNIADMVDKGDIKVVIDKVFNLEQAAEALDYLSTGHPIGKVVIKVTD